MLRANSGGVHHSKFSWLLTVFCKFVRALVSPAQTPPSPPQRRCRAAVHSFVVSPAPLWYTQLWQQVTPQPTSHSLYCILSILSFPGLSNAVSDTPRPLGRVIQWPFKHKPPAPDNLARSTRSSHKIILFLRPNKLQHIIVFLIPSITRHFSSYSRLTLRLIAREETVAGRSVTGSDPARLMSVRPT